MPVTERLRGMNDAVDDKWSQCGGCVLPYKSPLSILHTQQIVALIERNLCVCATKEVGKRRTGKRHCTTALEDNYPLCLNEHRLMGWYDGERLKCHVGTYAISIYTLWQFGSKRQHQQTVAIDGECQLRLGGIKLFCRAEVTTIIGKQQLLTFTANDDIAATYIITIGNLDHTIAVKPVKRCWQSCDRSHVDTGA